MPVGPLGICCIQDCTNLSMPRSLMCSHHIAESQRKPTRVAEQYHMAIYLIASDGCQEVTVPSEMAAERLMRILDQSLIDYVELYRVHPDVPEGTSPYEYLRHLKTN